MCDNITVTSAWPVKYMDGLLTFLSEDRNQTTTEWLAVNFYGREEPVFFRANKTLYELLCPSLCDFNPICSHVLTSP